MNAHPDRLHLESLDDLDSGSRQECLRHARGCSVCRGVLVSEDPSRLFALLALDPIDSAALDDLSRRVAAALEVPSASRPEGRLFAGALAASLLLAGLFSTYLWNRQEAGPAAAQQAAWDLPFPLPGESLGTIEVLSPEAAEVLNLQIGDTVLVMIFDEGLEL